MKLGYSTKTDEDAAKAIGKEVPIRVRAAIEITREIRGMPLEQAKRYLEEAAAMKRPVAFKRHTGGAGHRKGGMGPGKFPEKAAKAVLRVLNNAEGNAKYKGLDIESLHVVHSCAQRGTIQKKYMPRAFGRSAPFFRHTANIEIVLAKPEESAEGSHGN